MKHSIRFWLSCGIALCSYLAISPTQALPVPDATLPNNSVVTNLGFISTITGGTRAGGNLFHSFSEFSVPTKGVAHFNNPLDIQNIISRVTGASRSTIDGLIQANGKANLFLINPNGIIFDRNASLSIGGSFVASTASSLKFADGTQFSATALSTKPLLTISVPIGLQFGANPGSITNQSTAVNSSNIPVGLQVKPGNTLALVGGDVSLNGGRLTANGGRVELGGLTTAGTVGLNSDGSLSYPAAVQRGDVALTNGAFVNVAAAGGGSIAVNARNLDVAGGSRLEAGIGQGLGAIGSKAGDVTLNATDAITLRQASRIQNRVNSNAIGDSGNINITAGSLALTDGGYLSASTLGQGNAGNVNVDVRDAVTLFGVNNDTGSYSTIASNVSTGAVGNGGTITIKAGTLSILDQASLNASTFGQGNTGSVFVQAEGPVSLANHSDIFNNVESGANGNAGGIFITAGSLSLTDGAQLQSSIIGASSQTPGGHGSGGNVNINVRDVVTIAGANSTGNSSGIFGDVETGAVGNGGNINITASSLSFTDGAQLYSSTAGQGDAGSVKIQASGAISFDGVGSNGFASGAFSTVTSGGVGKGGGINVTTGSLSLTNGAGLNASTSGHGDAGSVFVQAKDSVSLANSNIFDRVESGAVGNGGIITIKAGTLSLSNGAQLQTIVHGASDTLPGGHGNAGDVNINVKDAVTGAGVNNGFPTEVTSGVGKGAVGNGGTININASSLSFTNGARLYSSTAGQGDAGSVKIQASGAISFDGVGSNGASGAFSTVASGGVGKGGGINVTTGSLSFTNGAGLNASTSGQGDAGSVKIQASGAISFDGVDNTGFSSGVSSTVHSGAVGNGGGININAGSLSITNQAGLFSSTEGKGNAGDISVGVDNAVSLTNRGVITGSVEPGGQGQGADISINARSLSVTNGSQVGAVVYRQQGNLAGGQGRGGQIQVNAADSVTLSGTGSTGFSSGLLALSERGASGTAGNITVSTGNFQVADGAIVAAGIFNSGGDGGNINIKANNFEALNGGQVLTNTRSSGNAGSIRLNAKDSITFRGSDPNLAARQAQVAQRLQSPGQTDQVSDVIVNESPASGLFANTGLGSSGNGGSIFIDPSRLTITNGAGVAVDSLGSGQGGNLNVQANYLTLDNRAFLSARANSSEGGNIALNVPSLLLMRHNSGISASAGVVSGSGNGGNITINTPFIVAVPSENSDITANAYTGKGGRVQISTQGVFGIQPQARDLSQSYISASSQLGINGTVQINTLDINPTQGLVNLPVVVPVDVTGLIAQGCPADVGPRASKFVVTGRGGLPPTPREALGSEQPLADLGTTVQGQENHASAAISTTATSSEPATIVEATGWVTNDKGEVVLVAQAPTVTPDIPWLRPTTCHMQ